VFPEREHLVGWSEATDILEAGAKARFVCPSCGQLWNDDDRETANRASRLVHRGQEVDPSGRVVGERPRTNTLGFRWTAANNLLVKTSVIGQDEWKASRAANEENAEKEMLQFVWALPHKSTTIDLTSLEAHSILKRLNDNPRGRVPTGTRKITVGIDVGKWLCHWVAVAWLEHATPCVIDYGRIEVPSSDMAEERAILLALRGFRDTVLASGWEADEGKRKADMTFIDSGYLPEAAYAFCRESPALKFWPSKGYGATQKDSQKFTQRNRSECLLVGDGFQVIRLNADKTMLVEINSDHWKSWVHLRLMTPPNQPGALTLFRSGLEADHLTIAKHFTSEKKVEEFVAGKGVVTRWVAVNRNNHYLDATSLAAVAASAVGERGEVAAIAIPSPPVPAPQVQSNDPYDFRSTHKGRW
jgi:phage terminase large subunit GpA-like protein